jgi:hypothetical protein
MRQGRLVTIASSSPEEPNSKKIRSAETHQDECPLRTTTTLSIAAVDRR